MKVGTSLRGPLTPPIHPGGGSARGPVFLDGILAVSKSYVLFEKYQL